MQPEEGVHPKMVVSRLGEASLFELAVWMFLFLTGLIAGCVLVYPDSEVVPGVSRISAILWLLFVVLMVKTSIEERGWRHVLLAPIASLGEQFVEIVQASGGRPEVRLGSRMFGRTFCHLRIPSSGIQGVLWAPGQGNVPGRDNHWVCFLRFNPDLVLESLMEGSSVRWGLIQIGRAGSFRDVDGGARSLLKFLTNAGVPATRVNERASSV